MEHGRAGNDPTARMMRTPDSADRVLAITDRLLIRDVAPVTPLGMSPKVVVGDDVVVSARLVADGQDILAAQVQYWPQGSPHEARCVPMDVDDSGRAVVTISFGSAGSYRFRIAAHRDMFSTWRRDLVVREAAGEDLAVEFLQGAAILERLLDEWSRDRHSRIDGSDDVSLVSTAMNTLRSETCSPTTKLRSALDPGLSAVVSSRSSTGGVTTGRVHPIRVDRERAVFGAWYEVFPRSEGGFRRGSALWNRLGSIADAGFDILYLPPVHPIGVTNRKGRNNTLVAGPDDVGSPWAIGTAAGGHDALDPSLGDLDDFRAFVTRANQLGVEIALDYALQCSPDHPWVGEHPEWFNRRVDGTIRHAENPPKKYEDIYPINFWPADDNDRVALWQACLSILWTWIDRGVKVFRVDNPHTKPLSFWRWIIEEVQCQHPDVVFLSEAFTDPTMMHSLAEVGFTQSYTYFTWRHDKAALTEYGLELSRAPTAGWFRPNLWPTTPDILTGRLRDGTPADFEVRALLAATLAPSWGMYSGYELCEGDPHPTKEEYAFSEKYELKNRDYDDPASIWGFISDLNRIRRNNVAFARMDTLAFHHVDHADVIAYSHVRDIDGDRNRVLVVVNLRPDATCEATVYLDRQALRLADGGPVRVVDQLTGESWNWSGYGDYVRLGPADRIGHVFTIDYGPG